MGWRTKRYGPLSVTRPCATGRGYGVKLDPSACAARTMPTPTANASAAPIAFSAPAGSCGHPGATSPTRITAGIRTNWRATQPPPRSPSCGTSTNADEADVVEARVFHALDELGRRRRVDRERHQRGPALG